MDNLRDKIRLLKKYENVILRIIGIILIIKGYSLLVNSPELGYQASALYISNAGLSGESKIISMLDRSYILSYQITGAILLIVGLFAALRKSK